MDTEDTFEITQPTPPTLQAQFDSIIAYQAINIAVAQWNNKQPGSLGEYTKTNTLYEYSIPEPINNYYYMPALPSHVEAGLFDGIELLDNIPTQILELPTMDWLRDDIRAWMDAEERKIPYNISDSKQQLLDKITNYYNYDTNDL